MANLAQKQIVVPNETNLNIHFYLNLFSRAIKKTPYWQFGGIFFGDFAPFLFSIEHKSAFRADPNVPIPGSYIAMVRKLHEKFIFGKFSFLAKIRGPENWIFRIFLKIAVIFFA